MNARRAHARKIIANDISWLEIRIARLETSEHGGERRRAECYRQLLRQRQRQLADADDPCAGCWRDYFG